ncbi:MAG: hypothetical protein HC945_04440 [Nitrosarchaeum sp.]|nr:hypothetical protein [Nitrosarchaeum sp.]
MHILHQRQTRILHLIELKHMLANRAQVINPELIKTLIRSDHNILVALQTRCDHPHFGRKKLLENIEVLARPLL